MAIVQVQKKAAQDGAAGTSHVPSLTSTPIVNNTLIVVIGYAADPGTVTLPANWKTATTKQRGTAQLVAIYYKTAVASEATSWTWQTVNSVQAVFNAFEYRGLLDSSNVADQVNGVDGGTGTVTTLASGTTGTTVQVDELAIAGFMRSGTVSGETLTNSYNLTVGASTRFSTGDKILSGTQTTSTTSSWTTAVTAVSAIATFKAWVGAYPVNTPALPVQIPAGMTRVASSPVNEAFVTVPVALVQPLPGETITVGYKVTAAAVTTPYVGTTILMFRPAQPVVPNIVNPVVQPVAFVAGPNQTFNQPVSRFAPTVVNPAGPGQQPFWPEAWARTQGNSATIQNTQQLDTTNA